MKNKFIIINVLLSVAVLFSILFHSIHSYEHHSEKLLEKKCIHLSSKNKTEVTHKHNVIEKCFSCDFSLSSFTNIEFFFIQFHKNSYLSYSSPFYILQNSSFFKGSLFSLRAPPAV